MSSDPPTPDGAAVDASSRRSSATGGWVRRLVGLGVLVAMAYLVYRLVAEVGWDEVGERLAAARLEIVALALGILVVQVIVWAERQHRIVRRVSRTPRWQVIFLSLVGTAAVNFLVPFARLVGGLLRARYMSRASRPHRPKRFFYGTVLFDQTVHALVMGSLTVLGIIAGAALLGQEELALGLGILAVLLAGGIALWLRRRPEAQQNVVLRYLERRSAGDGRAAGGFAAGEAAAKVFLELASDGRLWRTSGVLGLLVFLGAATAQWTVFAALGTEIDPLLVATTLTLGLSAGVLLGTPGGLGTTEAAMMALYAAFGVDKVAAASAVLLFRGLQFAVVLGLGLPSLALLELAYHHEPASGDEADEVDRGDEAATS